MAEVCCRTSFKLSKVIFHWKIENFSFLETQVDGETHFVESDEFCCSEDPQTKFRLRLYPSWRDAWRTTLEKVDVRVFFNNTSGRKMIAAKISLCVTRSTNEEIDKKNYPIRTYKANNDIYLTYISKADLFGEAGVLPDDLLNLFCEVTMNVGKVQESHTVFKMEEPMASQLPRDFSHLLDSGDFSDVAFVIGTETFQAHKVILAARSPVFAAMFRHDMKEKNQNSVEIVDVDPKIFRYMLSFVYTGKFLENQNVDTMVAKDLLVVADKYDIRDLKDICERILSTAIALAYTEDSVRFADERHSEESGASMSTAITLADVFDILKVSDKHNAEGLKIAAIEFIQAHLDKLKKT